MGADAVNPVYFGRLRSLPVLTGILRNPISATRRLHAKNGRYVILQYPHSTRRRPQILSCIADPGLYRTVILNSDAWRTVRPGAGSLRYAVPRLRGAPATHYRRLLSLPLSKPAVAGMSPDMAAIAKRTVDSWPRNQPTDFMPLANELMEEFAISLLFGDDHARALPIAKMINQGVVATWGGRAYIKWLLTAPKLQRAINEWADEKRGDLNPKDVFSVLVNNPDWNGDPPSNKLISGILMFTFGAAYETCQNAFAWTLVLLTQHPKIAAALTDEIDHAVGGGLPSMDKIGALPLLDGVTKEGMRLFPPVPLQGRRSWTETELGGVRIPAEMRVLISAYLINRAPELYSDPYKFMPERWNGLERSPLEYPVFGAGSRMCSGTLFGTQMVKIALAATLSRHRVELAPRAHIDYRTAITLTPYPGLPIVLREKKAAPRRTPFSGSIHELVDLPAAG